jgi:hypothetical protein
MFISVMHDSISSKSLVQDNLHHSKTEMAARLFSLIRFRGRSSSALLCTP